MYHEPKIKNDADPVVDFEIEGYHARQVVIDFRSQVKIMTKDNNWVNPDYMNLEYT